MWQHVTDHRNAHFIYDIATHRKVWASSTHHQMMIPGPLSEMIAYTELTKDKYSEKQHWVRTSSKHDDDNLKDAEVLVLPRHTVSVLPTPP